MRLTAPAFLACAALVAVAAVLALHRPAPAETFALIGVAETHEYVIDTGLTAQDCRAASYAHDMRFMLKFCELEA